MVLKIYPLYNKFESLPILERPWQKIAIDFIINLFLTMFEIQKIDAILIIVDCFTKYTVFISIYSDINAVELIELVYNHKDIRFNLFLNIVFDRSLIFINEF